MSDNQQDEVALAIQKAQLQAKRERNTAIGSLLDKAVSVLDTVLDDNDPAHSSARMRAAETAINLYVQQGNGERQDRALELQERRLELEEKKLALPQFQQNNLYINGQPPQTPEDAEALLKRKQAQDALLATFLPTPKPVEDVSDTETGDNTDT